MIAWRITGGPPPTCRIWAGCGRSSRGRTPGWASTRASSSPAAAPGSSWACATASAARRPPSGFGGEVPGAALDVRTPRPRRPRLGARVRDAAGGRAARPAREQRRSDGDPAPDHRRRLRDAVRHQPSRALRAHRPAAPRAGAWRAARRSRTRRDGVEHAAPPGPARPRRPHGRALVLAVARVRAVEAGEPAVHARAAAAGRRRRPAPAQRRRAPRLRLDEPAAGRPAHARQPDPARCSTPPATCCSRSRRRTAPGRPCARRPTPAHAAGSTTVPAVSPSSAATPCSSA